MYLLILVRSMLSSDLKIMLLLVDFLLVLLTTVCLTLGGTLDRDVAMLARARLDHLGPACARYLQALCQVAR